MSRAARTAGGRLGTPGLALRHLRAGPGTSILVAILVAITVLVVSLAPRALAQLSSEQLRSTLSDLSPLRRDLSAGGHFGYPTTTGQVPGTAAAVFDATDELLHDVTDRLEAPLSTVIGDAHWIVRTTGRTADRIGVPLELQPVVSLAVDLDWTDRIEIVEGELPSPWTGSDGDSAEPSDRAPIEIALSQATAENAGLAVGDLLDFTPAPLRVAGLYVPRDPSDDYWLRALDLQVGEPFPSSTGGILLYTGAYVDPATGVGLRQTLGEANLSVWYPVDGRDLEFDDAITVRDQTLRLLAVGRSLPSGEGLTFTTGLADAIDDAVDRMTLVVSSLALAAAGPIGVVLAVFALGVRSVIDRRRAALSLLSARGASGFQARSLMVAEGLLIAVPAGALGILAAAALIPVPVGPEAYLLPIFLALTPPVLFAVTTSPGSLSGSRADIRVRARTGVRWVLEVAAIGLAGLSLFLLFRRGLAETSGVVGVDPLLVATPLLLSVAVCILVLRVYPALMIGVQRWTSSRRGAVAVVGAARAVRAPALGFAASLALVVGISIAVFSSVLSTTVGQALETDARMTTGAELRVSAATFGDTTEDELRALPGVAAVAAFQRMANMTVEAGGHEKSVTVVFTDLAKLHEVRPDLPGPAASGAATRFYVSASLAEEAGVTPGDPASLPRLPGEVVGVLTDSAFPTVPRTWVLVDVSAAEPMGIEFDPHEALIDLAEGASVAELTPAIRDVLEAAQIDARRSTVHVIAAEGELAQARAEPVISGLQTALLLAALIAVLLSVLAIVLASLSASAVRNRLVAVLRILGMSARQLSGLMAWELAPVAVTAIVAGTALGLAELWIVLAALDLRPFLGAEVPPVAAVDPAQVAAVVAGFVIVVLAAGAVTTAIGRRLSPASNVKMGAE